MSSSWRALFGKVFLRACVLARDAFFVIAYSVFKRLEASKEQRVEHMEDRSLCRRVDDRAGTHTVLCDLMLMNSLRLYGSAMRRTVALEFYMVSNLLALNAS